MTIPILASLATEVFSPPIGERLGTSNTWWIEPKYDGHRVIIDYRTDIPKILNRNGRAYSAGPFRPKVPDAMRGCVVDGEYLPQDAVYRVFDVLKYRVDDDLDYRRHYEDRTDFSYAVFDPDVDLSFKCVIRHRASHAWINVIRGWANEGQPIDGVIFKLAHSPYTPGRTAHWLKFKFVSTLDAYVSRLNIDNKSNCALSLYDPLSDTEFEVGKASTAGKFVKVGSVVEVRFLKFTAGGRLREPRIIHVRDDKQPRECQIDQLIPFVPHLNDTETDT
jgi:ATP-dependent DNA ligase